MPGFKIAGSGGGPNSLAEVRRTHRWIFQSTTHLSADVLLVLKSANRPKLNFAEAEMHHNQEQIYYAGKHTWDPVTMTYYDVEQSPDVSAAMWDWVNVCLIVPDANVEPPNNYKATTSTLQMRDGMGQPTETWQIYNGWPKTVNWGSLDYTSSEIQTIEVEFRFDRAVKQQ